jgi:hypothetical protein
MEMDGGVGRGQKGDVEARVTSEDLKGILLRRTAVRFLFKTPHDFFVLYVALEFGFLPRKKTLKCYWVGTNSTTGQPTIHSHLSTKRLECFDATSLNQNCQKRLLKFIGVHIIRCLKKMGFYNHSKFPNRTFLC